MATNLDALLNATTITVSGSSITLSSLSDNERGILLIALLALHASKNYSTTSGKAVSERVMRSTGVVEYATVTPGAG